MKLTLDMILLKNIPENFNEARELFEKAFLILNDNATSLAEKRKLLPDIAGKSDEEFNKHLGFYQQVFATSFHHWFSFIGIDFGKKVSRQPEISEYYIGDGLAPILKHMLSAKYGKPYGLQIDLVSIHHKTIRHLPQFYYQFIGVAKYYGNKEKFYSEETKKRQQHQKLIEEKKPVFEQADHQFDKLISFLCPKLEDRLLRWEFKNHDVFDEIGFFRDLLKSVPEINEELTFEHTHEVLAAIRQYISGRLSHLLPIDNYLLFVMLKFVLKHQSHNYLARTYSRRDEEWQIAELEDFESIANFLDLDRFIDKTSFYCSNSDCFFLTIDEDEVMNQGYDLEVIKYKFSVIQKALISQYNCGNHYDFGRELFKTDYQMTNWVKIITHMSHVLSNESNINNDKPKIFSR